MGLDIASIRYHLFLKKKGVSFEKVAMLGRQSFFSVTAADLSAAMKHAGFKMDAPEAFQILSSEGGYAEPFYRWLGASVVDSFDASDYEKATHLWNMNRSIEERFQGMYDFVYDGGTLEHVFSYPSALREAMTLPKQGGLFLSATPTNSYPGHGFYQIGPETAFQVLTAANGYENAGVHFVEERARLRFYRLEAPYLRNGRILAGGAFPTIMYFLGRKSSDVPERLAAMQSDYSSAWNSGAHVERGGQSKVGVVKKLLGVLPVNIRNQALRSGKLMLSLAGGDSFRNDKGLSREEEM